MKGKTMALDKAKIVEELSNATVIEVADLVKELEAKWGVSAAAPVAVAAVGAGGAAAAPAPAAAATATGAAAETPHLVSSSFTSSAISITVALLSSSTIFALSRAIVTFHFVSSSPTAMDALSSRPANRRFTLLLFIPIPIGLARG